MYNLSSIHRILEWFVLEGTSKIIQLHTGRAANHYIRHPEHANL